MEISRAQRVAAIKPELEVGSDDADGWRPITTLAGVEVGLLREVSEGRWRLAMKLEGEGQWRENVTELEQRDPEQAEAWAVETIANDIAMTEEAEERDRGS